MLICMSMTIDKNYTPKQIRTIIRNAIDKVAPTHGYDYCEDSTRVLTIKQKDYKHSKILHSYDFDIVFNGKNGQQFDIIKTPEIILGNFKAKDLKRCPKKSIG